MKAAYTRIGWKTLRADINHLVDAINANQPVEGAGIRIRDGAAGKVIETAVTEGNLPGNNASQSQTTAQHGLTNYITWIGVKWVDLTTVDPVTCQQSTVKVLMYTGNASDTVDITIQDINLWSSPQ